MSYPVNLRLANRRVLVVGGGRLAMAHVETLLGAGAQVTIVAPELHPDLDNLVQQAQLTWHNREFDFGDLDSAWLVVAVTNDGKLNALICKRTDELGKLAYGDGDGERGNLALPLALTRGKLQIAVYSGVPHLAKAVVHELEDDYGPEFTAYTDRLAAFCTQIDSAVPSEIERQRIVHRVTSPAMLQLVRMRETDQWQQAFAAALAGPSSEARTEVETWQ